MVDEISKARVRRHWQDQPQSLAADPLDVKAGMARLVVLVGAAIVLSAIVLAAAAWITVQHLL